MPTFKNKYMIEIKAVNTKRELLKFIKFNIELYKSNKYAVPPLIIDELNTLSKDKNPAFDFCECQCFLCYRDGKIVGRIAAIINHKSNATWNKKYGRFGFFDFIEDIEVAQALIEAAEEWATERGMTAIEGPLGFTDMDNEGMLVEGFDQMGTMATIYNYPYYPKFMEQMGFTKEADWVECKVFTPKEVPPRVVKVAKIVEARTGVRVLKFKNNKEIIEQGWGKQLFEVTNAAFASLYGYSELSPRQIEMYTKQYLPLVRLEFLTMVVDKDNKLIAYGLGLPSLSKAMKKARGKMFPFGLFYLLKALKSKKLEIIDFMLIAVRPEWQGRGVNSLVMRGICASMIDTGVVYAESNPELEVNTQVGAQWDNFTVQYHKRRRAYIRPINKF